MCFQVPEPQGHQGRNGIEEGNGGAMFPRKLIFIALVSLLTFPVYGQDAAKGAFLKGDIVYGSATAPVEIIEYGSMTCPHCGHFGGDIFPQVKKELVDTGKVRFVFRNFVRDRYDIAVASISRCTSDMNVTKALLHDYFSKQEDWMRASNPYEVIASIAEKHGVSRAEVGRCMSDQEAQTHLIEMTQEGIKTYQIERIPFFLVNGKHLQNYSFEAIKAAVDAEG